MWGRLQTLAPALRSATSAAGAADSEPCAAFHGLRRRLPPYQPSPARGESRRRWRTSCSSLRLQGWSRGPRCGAKGGEAIWHGSSCCPFLCQEEAFVVVVGYPIDS